MVSAEITTPYLVSYSHTGYSASRGQSAELDPIQIITIIIIIIIIIIIMTEVLISFVADMQQTDDDRMSKHVAVGLSKKIVYYLLAATDGRVQLKCDGTRLRREGK